MLRLHNRYDHPARLGYQKARSGNPRIDLRGQRRYGGHCAVIKECNRQRAEGEDRDGTDY